MRDDFLINHDFSMTPFFLCDCLIIGAGAAGLRAAIEASKYGNVLVLIKKDITFSNTQYAQGGIAVVMNSKDSYESHITDTIVAGSNFCNKKAVEHLVKEGPKRVKDLIHWGAQFDKKQNGHLKFTTEGGHTKARILHAGGDATGKEIVKTLYQKANSIDNIKILENHFAIDLLHHEKTCYGVLALDLNSKKKIGVLAKQVILASGGSGCVYQDTTNPLGATGDGCALAFRAGANLVNMEFMQFHPTTLYIAGAPRFLISEAARGEGAILRDDRGVAFMAKYHPLKDLAPRDIVSKAITDLMIERSLNNVYLDLRHLDSKFLKKRFPNIMEVCLSFNINIAKDLIPVRPSAHYHMGGIKTDFKGKTNIKNLYACGETASTGCHGANRLASNSLLEALVFGKNAGDCLKLHINQKLIGHPLDKIKSTTKNNLSNEDIDFFDILSSARSIMWKKAGVYRDKDSLLKASRLLKGWHKSIMKHELSEVNHFETVNILTIALLITQSALKREESRGSHQRSDFPFTEKRWKSKHVELNKETIT
ncbi:MAG: L-aspartate oxidase [Planctomycetota bacterium]|nr:MAG: L-aspartate oxidase [Planctomycetota bacterium]